MDFAKNILKKYGWKEGDGLGKTNNGITKALRANLKFDKAGFGSDVASSDFNNHWWERVFNEAASNVNVKQKDDGETEFDLINEGVEISTKGYSLEKLKKARRNQCPDNTVSYGNFLQTATLKAGGGAIEVDHPGKINIADMEVAKVNIMTDEELFAACGGRTAHKGARHGLKLSGKLSRLEKQEQELLAKMFGGQPSLQKSTKAEEVSGIVADIKGLKRKEKCQSPFKNTDDQFSYETAKPSKRKRKCNVTNMPESNKSSKTRKEGTKLNFQKSSELEICEINGEKAQGPEKTTRDYKNDSELDFGIVNLLSSLWKSGLINHSVTISYFNACSQYFFLM
ncbi:G patch domain-containing protein 4 [Glossina fuscipes]|uniref:G patch domain-containing protein 4 n=1 Tax=Glossina fuscipes TaxID=7396 RepID=A0A8U0WL65_9MUSC|nr:G patch domain-containing protein 4 [Glossina fuscipes]